MKSKKLGILALTLLITGAIDSIRNLPAAAIFGSSLVFFFILAGVVFLIPTALVSAELAANVDEGGIYQWCRIAFGNRIAFLAVWLQWINSVVWFPTILSFIAGTACYLIDPALAQNKYYLISIILSSFWFLTWVNLKGIHFSARFTGVCTVLGLIIPMTLIITLLGIWLFQGKPLQIHLTPTSVLPNWHAPDTWVSLTAIIAGFLGLELATVHIKEVKNPQATFPKALFFSTIIILTTMILGSLAIAFVLPYDQINLVSGTIQTFSYYLAVYDLNWLEPVLTCLLVLGSLGGITSWIISPIRGIAQAAHQGFIPLFLQRENKNGVPKNLLILQAVLVSIVCVVFLLFPSVNASYWLLTALSTQLYVLMYVMMFLSALFIRRKKARMLKSNFNIPGHTVGLWMVSLLGLLGCALTLAVGFIPPANIDIGSKWHYEFVFCISMLVMIAPVGLFYLYGKRSRRS